MTATSPATSARPVYTDIGKALGTDYFLLKADLTTAESGITSSAPGGSSTRKCCRVINDYWERAEVPVDLCRRLGELGLIGDGLEGYGCPPMSSTAAGLIAMELNRGDGSVGTFLRRAGRAGDALDPHARLRRAEAALAAGDGALRKAGRVRADRTAATARIRCRWRPRRAATVTSM